MDLVNSPAWAQHVNELLHQLHTPGLAIAVVQNDAIVSNGFGLATLSPPSNVTADTLFDIASMSKSFTAASVGLFVVDDTKYPGLHWDTPMSDLLTEDFVMSGDGYTEQVTVEDILSHRSGFPRHDYSYFDSEAKQGANTPQSITRNLRNLPNAAPLRERWIYSNVMYIVASWLVEKISGLPFAEFLHQEFFEPLGMGSTYVQPDAAIDAGLCDRFATPYVFDEETESLRAVQPIQAPEAQGCGSIFTSANDMIKWVWAIMNKKSPISKELYRGLVKPRIRMDLQDDQDPDTAPWYAAGLQIFNVHGEEVIGHGGLTHGYHSLFFFLPEFKFGAVLLGNSAGDNGRASEAANTVAIELIEDVLKAAGSNGIPKVNRERKLWSRASATGEDEDLKQRLCPGSKGEPIEDIKLKAYIGRYCNDGYRCLTVETKDNALFFDASDRSEAFELRFEHVCDGTKFLAHIADSWEGGDDLAPSEFELLDDRAVRMGIQLEDELEEYIWFDRISGAGARNQVVMGGD